MEVKETGKKKNHERGGWGRRRRRKRERKEMMGGRGQGRHKRDFNAKNVSTWQLLSSFPQEFFFVPYAYTDINDDKMIHIGDEVSFYMATNKR